MKAFLIPASAVLLIFAAGCGSTAPKWRVVSQGTYVPAVGHVNVDTQGTAAKPAALGVKLSSTPTVKVLVGYAVNCGSGFAPVSGQVPLDLAAVAAASVTEIPVPDGKPKSCFVEVIATPTQAARVTVSILSR
jgi:hypothetical protein